MKKQVQKDTPQWAHLDRQTQVIIGKSSVNLISAFKFDQTSQNSQLHILKNNKDKTWVDATVNITDFSKDYYRQVIAKQVALQDVILYTGHVNIHKYTSQPYKIFTFLLCKVCLGTAGTSSTPKVENCDSIIISPQSTQAFQYNFFVKQHWQYQVKYEVNFTVSEQKQFKISQYSCCNCQNRTPTIYCSTQHLYFCEECCNDHHKPKLMHSHLLQTIDKVNTLQNCKTHNQKFQLYCLKCQKYLCQVCTQKGIHAQGSDHVVKPIRYYYSELNQNIEVLPKKSLQKIQVFLHNLGIKRKQIQDNQKEVRRQIQMQYKRCLKLLQEQTAKKYQILDSSQLQLTLLKDKISWNQSFSLFQSSALKPIHYFKSQVIFEQQMKKIKVGDFDTVLSCKPDIIYESFNLVGLKSIVDKNISVRKQLDQQRSIRQSANVKKQVQYLNNSQNKMDQVYIEKARNLLIFDSQAETPPNGALITQLFKCDLKFFQFKSK